MDSQEDDYTGTVGMEQRVLRPSTVSQRKTEHKSKCPQDSSSARPIHDTGDRRYLEECINENSHQVHDRVFNSVSPSDAIENTDRGAEQQDVEFGHSRDPSHVRLRESSEEDRHRPPTVEESMMKVFSLLVTRLENSEARYEADKAHSSSEAANKSKESAKRHKEDKTDRDIRPITWMAYPEDLFSALTRFKRFLTGVDRYQWVAALEFLFSGRNLDTYLANVDSFVGDYVGLKRVLLISGGFSINDCIDSIYNPYHQHGGMSATTWVKQNSYKIYTILR